ncbi:hypothetical protein V5738_13560 [Salinisphaera sp. SPP-AMP-43]|uniref:hypothetical protein n=1 Tax=Salinisphaera sp. SPP-AMP-43 TaxID=3121288 RepID=UPI003C6DECFB
MNTIVAAIERRERRTLLQMPWPLVQPEPGTDTDQQAGGDQRQRGKALTDRNIARPRRDIQGGTQNQPRRKLARQLCYRRDDTSAC